MAFMAQLGLAGEPEAATRTLSLFGSQCARPDQRGVPRLGPWNIAASDVPACRSARSASARMMFGAWGEPIMTFRSRSSTERWMPASTSLIPADVYSQGESESIVGKALAGGRRDDVILATQGHTVRWV